MTRCKKCVITSERFGIKFNKEGICYPCLAFEEWKKIDWSSRWLELDELCSKFRKHDGSYDCIICVSGGKDSTFQTHLFKDMLAMHPLGIMIDNGSWSKTGRDNFYNLCDRFGLDVLTFTINHKELRRRSQADFYTDLHPWKYWDEILYRKPLELAQALGIKLVVWGEDTSITTGGKEFKETPSAKKLLQPEDQNKFPEITSIFTSYYVPWSRYENIKYSKANGFKGYDDTKEWVRQGLTGWETEQVDTIGYSIQMYFRFIKYGFSNQTELCSDAIRHGKMTREKALEMVNKEDWMYDPIMLKDFCKFLQISEKEFWSVVDSFANTELLEKRDGVWRLKQNAV